MSTTALRHAPRRWRIALLPLLALVIAGAMAAASASELMASALQRQCCRGGSSGRSASLRGGRAPVGWPCAAAGVAPSVEAAIDRGRDLPTPHPACLRPASAQQSGARHAHVAVASSPAGGVSSPGLPAPSSRAPPVA